MLIKNRQGEWEATPFSAQQIQYLEDEIALLKIGLAEATETLLDDNSQIKLALAELAEGGL